MLIVHMKEDAYKQHTRKKIGKAMKTITRKSIKTHKIKDIVKP